MTDPRRRRAISLGLLLPGLLLPPPGAADADRHTSTSQARKPAPRTEIPAARKVVSRAHAGPSHRVLGQSGSQARAQARGQTVHVVRSGDSMSRIAAHYGVTRKSLIGANKLARPEQLRIGQRLVVPRARVAAGGGPRGALDAG